MINPLSCQYQSSSQPQFNYRSLLLHQPLQGVTSALLFLRPCLLVLLLDSILQMNIKEPGSTAITVCSSCCQGWLNQLLGYLYLYQVIFCIRALSVLSVDYSCSRQSKLLGEGKYRNLHFSACVHLKMNQQQILQAHAH